MTVHLFSFILNSMNLKTKIRYTIYPLDHVAKDRDKMEKRSLQENKQ